MSLAKVIEVMAEGENMEQAINNAVLLAAKTVQEIKSVYVENMQGVVENNKVVRYRVNAKITFMVKNT
ncbi:MAG: dodecin family protein [Fodinibius sp.]|nr:dodecin family protein [Fodinibius sp.]